MKKILAFAAIILFFASCERDLVFDTITETPPELHVFVYNSEGNKLSGTMVSVYKSEEDANSSNNTVASKSTDNDGKAVFAENELVDPGVFYVKATTNDASVVVETPYLLLNDGQTYLNITLQ